MTPSSDTRIPYPNEQSDALSAESRRPWLSSSANLSFGRPFNKSSREIEVGQSPNIYSSLRALVLCSCRHLCVTMVATLTNVFVYRVECFSSIYSRCSKLTAKICSRRGLPRNRSLFGTRAKSQGCYLLVSLGMLASFTRFEIWFAIVSTLALIPVAKLLGVATTELSYHVGGVPAKFMRAFIGNSVEIVFSVSLSLP